MMAYQNGFVATLICNNKPIREFNKADMRTCKIPFDSEYKVRLINRSRGRAYAKISIDGTEVVTGDRKFVLNCGQTMDVERFVDDLNTGKKFKFISIEQGMATGEIQDPGSPDNGIIEVTFFPERSYVKSAEGRSRKMSSSSCREDLSATMDSCAVLSGTGFFRGGRQHTNTTKDCYNPIVEELEQGLSGATVEGSSSNQQFNMTNEIFETTAPVIIKIKLEAPAAFQFGVYVSHGSKPIEIFPDKRSAAMYIADNDFGDAPVTVRPY